MRKKDCAAAAVFTVSALLVVNCSNRAAASDDVDFKTLKLFAPLPELVLGRSGAPTREQISLGRLLYFDPRLSKSQTIFCNTCHPLTKYGVDGQVTSEGYQGQHGDRNAPSVYNAAGHFTQFWDGRAADVEEQAKGPVRNPIEMAMASERDIVGVLRSMPEYVDAFQRAFPQDREPLCFDNMAVAIGAFERKLLTPGRWDRFLRGDETALTAKEKSGLNAFLAAGCQTCHAGALVGGSAFQKLGVAKPYPDASDPGRYKVTHTEADRMVFKVPSLRNVAMMAPYFHNGKGRFPSGCGGTHGRVPKGPAVARTRGPGDCQLARGVDGRHPGRLHQGTGVAQEYGTGNQTEVKE
jgi:cytochrome c peroxidase